MSLDIKKVEDFSKQSWDQNIIPTLSKYIEIPNQSPLYDKEWATNGYTEEAIQLLYKWVIAQNIAGSTCEIKTIGDLSPIIFIVIEATKKTNAKNVLLYGHMDKQPPITDQWTNGLHPYKAIIRDGKLYGRGGADDGYSTFASIEAIQCLKKQGIEHDRYVIIIEGSEESGSIHLPAYIDQLAAEIQTPNLIICLDSGCGNYDQLWVTASLRGVMTGDLTVKVLDEANHSGAASGIVPSSFRIIRQLLSRLEDPETGEVTSKLHVDIPSYRIDQTKLCAQVLGNIVFEEFAWNGQTQPISKDPFQLLINKTWKPTLCTTGVDGIPPISNAGNVMRTSTTLKLSIRLPPSFDSKKAGDIVKEILETNPPYGSTVTFKCDKSASGWDSPAIEPWLEKALQESSQQFFNKPHVYLGEGGTIPFMGMLGAKFPKAQFVITGLLGPGSNAHGPNEFLDIEYAKKLTGAVVYILAAHAALN
ncbi:Succinyl-diaminopimelate desuccinylase [Tieghemostelium lacteum]|uniref:Succinyl-diaminopimelate desuccinylase n=1 Tax=Tieghemostelium lacteum TaxID=361077 RepID=A0A152A2P2_TIELA|nr:Succinyl-diaminopimelate desuccinylase [Tieghemostelium lacteum]|eukprot:KYR00523.1 Succinyl-diaminopimelate desuccinylase [Tieghemostelium lacteum]